MGGPLSYLCGMNMDIDHLLPDFPPESRIWIYQANRCLTLSEALKAEDILQSFQQSWNTHGLPVRGFALLFFGQFIVFAADERERPVSGCSTDSSVEIVRRIGQEFNVNFFDRLLLAFLIKDRVQVIPLPQLAHGLKAGLIGPDTLYFDNTVPDLGSLRKRWPAPLRQSWLAADKRFSELIRQGIES